jgi:hypothetical protein
MTTEHKPQKAPTFNGREARKFALQQYDGSGSVWDVLAFQLLGAVDHIESLEEQLEALGRGRSVLVALVRDAEERFLQIMEPERDVQDWLTRVEVAEGIGALPLDGSNPASEPESA